MGYGRTRIRTSTTGNGTVVANGTTTTYAHPGSFEQCVDYVGNKAGANPLAIDRIKVQAGTITTVNPSNFAQLKNYPFENQAFYPNHNINPVLPSDIATITETMAKTNPSRPEVSLPQFIAELRDIPGMLHLNGRVHDLRNRERKGFNSSAIEQNFGWSPFIQDLIKMADFTAHVDSRLKELRDLHSKQGLSRGMTAFSTTVKNREPNVTFNSAWSHPVTGFVTYEGIVRKWGSVHWIPSVPFRGTDGDLARMARYLVHGWDSSPGALASTLWELIPWSWFIDYFANVGDYLSANRNGANAIASMGCVMEHHRTVAQQVLFPHGVDYISRPGRRVLESKSRHLTSAGLSATVPFLSTGQLVTMSSLAQSLAGLG